MIEGDGVAVIADGDDAPRPLRLVGSAIADRVYSWLLTAFALCIPALLLLLVVALGIAGWPAFSRFGFAFLTSSTWNPVAGIYGAAPAIYGTVVTSLIALAIATPLGVGVALFLSDLAPRKVRQPVAFLVDLLAAIPSVVYGLWGIFVLLPFLRETLMPFLRDTLGLGGTVFFSGPAYGPSMLAAGIILSVMVLPYISAISREVLLAVPRSQREAALALGATRWEMIKMAVLPFGRSGVISGAMLGLGRALGETIAVALILSGLGIVSFNLISNQNSLTIASNIALDFPESSGLAINALIASGLVLFLVTFLVNAFARYIINRRSEFSGAN